MCKNLMISGITEETHANALKFIEAALPGMTKHDGDGVGYAASRLDNGELFGERWLNTKEAFKRRTPLTERDNALLEHLGLAVDVEASYNSFGEAGVFSSILFHARFATCGVNLDNVHPFVRDDTALIHNGVIKNAHAFKRTLSTCDSEAILSSYLSNGVDQNVDMIADTGNELEGYYACGVLARNREGVRVMDIFKNDGANLCVAWVKQLDAWVYCTSADIIKAAARKCRFEISAPHAIKSGWLIRLNASTGECMGMNRFSAKPVVKIGAMKPYQSGWLLNEADEKLADYMDAPNADEYDWREDQKASAANAK